MGKYVRIARGSWNAGRAPKILHTEWVCECVVLVLYSSSKKMGAMAHIKFTPWSIKSGIEGMLKWFQKNRVSKSEIRAYIYYNSNWLLPMKSHTPFNIQKIKSALSRAGIEVEKTLGYSQYHVLIIDFDLETGEVSFLKDETNPVKKALWLDKLGL